MRLLHAPQTRSKEAQEVEMMEELAKNTRRRRFLYRHGRAEDLPEFEKLEGAAVRLIEKINQLRGVSRYTIKTTTRGTIRR